MVDGSVVSAAGGQHVAPDKREIGYVAQEGALFPHLSVAKNVAFGLARGERRNGMRTSEALELVGLDRAMPTGALTSSPVESSVASLLHGRSRRARAWCCSTSRSRGSTHTFVRRPARRSRLRSPQRARPRCSSPTIKPRRCRW